MTALSDDAQQTLQLEVQRLLGRCMLRLQQYERLIKAVIACHEISGPGHALETVQAARIDDTAGKTLGTLVGDLLGSYVVPYEIDPPGKVTTSSLEDVTSFAMKMQVSLPNADFTRVKKDLKELVLLRNNLVHHFIDQHDLNSLDGCSGAQDALVAAYNRIDQHVEQLREWVEDTEQTRRKHAEFLHSEVFQDMVLNGIAPDGTVDWSNAGVMRALREAAGELAVDGWTSVAEASKWIAERYPEQLPAKYGCSSWRQVVHESRVFELRYFEMDGQRCPCYRKKESSANTC